MQAELLAPSHLKKKGTSWTLFDKKKGTLTPQRPFLCLQSNFHETSEIDSKKDFKTPLLQEIFPFRPLFIQEMDVTCR